MWLDPKPRISKRITKIDKILELQKQLMARELEIDKLKTQLDYVGFYAILIDDVKLWHYYNHITKYWTVEWEIIKNSKRYRQTYVAQNEQQAQHYMKYWEQQKPWRYEKYE